MNTLTKAHRDGKTRRVAVTLDRAATQGRISLWIRTASAFMNLSQDEENAMAQRAFTADLEVNEDRTQEQRVDHFITQVFPHGVK